MKKIYYLLVIALLSVISCKPDESATDEKKPFLELSLTEAKFDHLAGSKNIKVTTNRTNVAAVSADESWCTVSSESEKIVITVTPNDALTSREIDVTVTCDDESLTKVVKVTQESLTSGLSAGDDIRDDIKVNVVSATASSVASDSSIERTYDGDYTTNYHSGLNNTAPDYWPIELTYYFKTEGENIDYLIYHPHSKGNHKFKEVNFYVTTKGTPARTKVGAKMFEAVNSPQSYTFDPPLKGVTSLEFEILSGSAGAVSFATCGEIDFLQINNENFNPLTLFTDESCSKLKDGVTMAEISACTFSFFRRIATYLFDGAYPSDFRIASYKAWMNPETQRKQIRNSFAYSLLDNPTGIIAEKDTELVVLVGETNGANLSIKIQNLDNKDIETEGDGYYVGSSTYLLKKGANKIIPRNRGLIYVLYHSDTPDSKTPINIHFPNGEVNGYYDINKHTAAEDWTRLLEGSKDKYFDLVGEYAHLTFPAETFKKNTPDGKALIEAYDRMVREEQVFMGLERHGKMFKNRMYFHVMYGKDDYMYATSNRTAYHVGTLDAICNVDKFKTTDIWGPAHEVGHANQITPGFKWLGMTEVTNNIHSMYIQRLFGNRPRLLEEGGKQINRYVLANANMAEVYKDKDGNIVDRPYAKMGNVFLKLVPFWQLYLYLVEAQGKVDFYKDLYENIRLNPAANTETGGKPDPGKCQLEFVRIACVTAQLDLTAFFVYWGFLTPIDEELDDYGKGHMLITQEQITAAKAVIAGLGLGAPNHTFNTITDDNISAFR